MDDQSEVIAFLSDGASYGSPGETVERLDTHCSIIFLVGNRAYKLKRAVAFSYLDYSTLALREKFCRAEVTLNRRTAPELYLGVRSIARLPDGRLGIGGSGSVIDWVVELRRFDQDDLYDRLAEARGLTPASIRELADEIAAFHSTADVVRLHGGQEGIAEAISGNHANLVRHSPPFDKLQVDKLQKASLSGLAALGPLLDGRRDGGKVRRCHGDLHLGNVCRFAGRPTLFDCIEFNDAFSCIDVLYDLAFLLMDLTQRRLDGLASEAFNRYLDLTGDVGGIRALPLFMSVRAATRAHVLAEAMRHQKNRGAPDPMTRPRAYLELANELLRPQAPRLIAIGGLSGTGKSTIARTLAPDFRPIPGARLIRTDTLRKRLVNVSLETRLPRESYTSAKQAEAYDAAQKEAAATLASGYTAIVDATFLRPEDRQAIRAVARRAGVPFTGLWLEAPAETLIARVGNRRNDPSDADLAVLAQQRRRDAGEVDWHRIDAGGGISSTAAAARICTDLSIGACATEV